MGLLAVILFFFVTATNLLHQQDDKIKLETNRIKLITQKKAITTKYQTFQVKQSFFLQYFVNKMPRIRPLSHILQQSSSIQSMKQTLPRPKPSHITMFCSQQEGETLLQVLDDVKPVRDFQKKPILQKKLVRSWMVMEESARDVGKLALAGNQVRLMAKMVVVNGGLLSKGEGGQRQAITRQAQLAVQRIKATHSKHPSIIQKLTTALTHNPITPYTCHPSLSPRWLIQHPTQQQQQSLTSPYTLLINPSIIYGSQPTTLPQQCISFPFLQFMIPRYNRLLIHYYNEDYVSRFAYVEGFTARVIQHQCEHLEGRTVMDWRVSLGGVKVNEGVQGHFTKATAVVEGYAKALKEVFGQFRELAELREEYVMDHKLMDRLLSQLLNVEQQQEYNDKHKHQQQVSTGRRSKPHPPMPQLSQAKNYNTPFTILKHPTHQQLPFEDDYITRMVKHFKKQFAKFDQKIQLGLITPQTSKNKQHSHPTSQPTPSPSSTQYNQQQYSKTIKIRYMKGDRSQTKPTLKQTKKADTQHQNSSLDVSDQELDKLMAKHKKGKKKK